MKQETNEEGVMNGMVIGFLMQVMLWAGIPGSPVSNSSVKSSPADYEIGTETIQKDLKVNSGTLILLDTDMGNVSIDEYDGSNVKVDLKLEGTPEAVAQFHFTHDYFGNQLTLKAWYEKNTSNSDPRLRKVRFVISVPRDSSYSFQTTTRSGDIDVAISKNMKGISLSSGSGKVQIKIPCNIAANIDASTSSIGKVRLTPSDLISRLCLTSEIYQPDHFKGKVNGGGAEINAYAGIGDIFFEIVPGM